MSGIAFSTSESMSTLSTYWSSIMCSRLLSLLLPLFTMFSLFPENLLVKNVPINIPAITHAAISMGIYRLFLLCFILLR